jgi:hypothetical protein
MFASPVFLVSSGLATLWAAMFHLFLGKNWADLLLYWFVGLVGFAVGQGMAEALRLPWLTVGQVHMIEGTIGCWVAMLVAWWLKL